MLNLSEYLLESVSKGGSKRKYLDIHSEEFHNMVKTTNMEDFIDFLLKRSDIRKMRENEKMEFYRLDDDLNDPYRFKKMKVFDGSMAFDIDLGELYIVVDNHLIRMMYGGDGKYHYCNMTELDNMQVEESKRVMAVLLKHTNVF